MRKCAGVSQIELGKILDLHQAAVCRIESGDQSIQPWQIQQLGEFFGITVSELLGGVIDYWHVASRFERELRMPARYRELPYSKLREVLPALKLLYVVKGEATCQKLLKSWELEPAFLRNPDQPTGVHLQLDLLRYLIETGALNKSGFDKMVQMTRTEEVQGFLHNIYRTQTSAINVVKTMIMNVHHYEQNFHYEMECTSKNSLNLTISPAEHMRSVDYKGDGLDDFLCRYKQAYLSHLPEYIGASPATIKQQECLFQGGKRCVYRIKTG